MEALSRPFPLAVAGTGLSYLLTTTGEFVMEWTDRAGEERSSLVYLPSHLYTHCSITTSQGLQWAMLAESPRVSLV